MIQAVIHFYTKTFAVWVILFGVLAYFVPAPFLVMKGGMKEFFALTMFGIGVAIKPEDFKRILLHPTVILIGSIAQFTIMPLGAFAISYAFILPEEIMIGLILTGSAPGAMASNVMSYIAKADAAYSVSLTTVSTLACPLLTPGLTYLLAGAEMHVPFFAMMMDIMYMVVIPLLIGFAVRYYAKTYAKTAVEKILFVFPAISSTFIIFICAVVIASNRNYLPQITGIVLITVFILNLYGMAAGYGVGKLFRMETKRRRALAIEIGMQNAGLGTVLALEHFGERAAAPAALFVFVCIITASVLAEWWQSKDGTAEAPRSETA